MEISGLDITLRRIQQIEQTFESIETTTDGGEFNNVLQQAMASPFSEMMQDDDTPQDIDGIVKEKAGKYNLDQSLLKAVIKAESGFNSKAVSPAGAAGLMQLMPGTARGLGVNDVFDANQNIEGGAKYLKGLLDRFDGDKKLALAAYNAGPNAVKKYGGIPPYRETQAYVKRVLDYEKNYN